jgi:hypothetical protein
MMKKSLAIGIAVAGRSAWAEGANSTAALANALSEASVSLDQKLKASQSQGQPSSGKYEVENGAVQLSVYTTKGDQFAEVVVDHKSGSIKKAEPITDANDLKDAKEQEEATGKAPLSLRYGCRGRCQGEQRYRAVSAVPMLIGGQPVASITPMKGEEVKKVTEKPD